MVRLTVMGVSPLGPGRGQMWKFWPTKKGLKQCFWTKKFTKSLNGWKFSNPDISQKIDCLGPSSSKTHELMSDVLIDILKRRSRRSLIGWQSWILRTSDSDLLKRISARVRRKSKGDIGKGEIKKISQRVSLKGGGQENIWRRRSSGSQACLTSQAAKLSDQFFADTEKLAAPPTSDRNRNHVQTVKEQKLPPVKTSLKWEKITLNLQDI